MKNRQNRGRYTNRFSIMRNLAAAVLLASLSACGGGESGTIIGDEPVIIGTGIQFDGTVPTNRKFADSTIGIKSASGELTTGTIGSNGRFSVDDVLGSSPYLLRVDLGNDQAYYGIAHSLSASSVTQNVHAYSDLAIRNWFATQGLDIDSAFNSTGPIASLPSESEIAAIDTQILSVLREALAAYGLTGTNLSTISFDADDLGVDQFLDRNPVLINNGSITIIINEPNDDTQTVVAEGLPINTDLTASDDVPPSAPLGLRVLPSASNEIVLAWESATDNIAVSGYEVLRDGLVIATTAFPLYIDSPLDSGVTFTYSIVAIDAAENRSLPSVVGSAQTLAAPDTLAPPAATGLSFETSSNSIAVRWVQSGISDVASFRVLRGEGSTMLDQVARVTTTALVDGGLNSGTEYCYQIVTSDASENESGPSQVGCATTNGTNLGGAVVVTTPENPTNPVQPGSSNGLLAVDVSGLACETELETVTITEPLTLDASCLRVTRDINVNQGGQLIVAAGTVLKFEAGIGVQVNTGGSLAVNGTVAEPVVFSAIDPTPGIWDGVLYRTSNSTRNVLNNLVIEFGGQASGAALETLGFTSSQSRLSVSNVLVRGSIGAGVEISNNTILGDFNGLISTGNARSALVSGPLAANFGLDSQLVGNTQDGLIIDTTAITSATVWQKIDVPFLLNRMSVDAPLSIAAGSELRFQAGGSLDIGDDGSLSAIGTAAERIRFTGTEMTPGYWSGIEFRTSNSTNNRLEHVVVEYAGSGASDGAGVYVIAFSSSPGRLAVANTVFQSNEGPGFRFSANVILPEFSNVQSTGNGLSGVMAPAAVSSLGENLDFQGNTQDGLRLISGTLDTATTWPALNVPYLFDRVTVDATLTVSSGASFIADSGAIFDIGPDGALNAVGTAAMPISFVGAQSITGHWDGLYIDTSNSALNVLEFVTLANAGGGGASASSGNITMRCFSSAPAQITISNSTISDSAGFGIYKLSETCSANVGANVTFSGNVQGAINTP